MAGPGVNPVLFDYDKAEIRNDQASTAQQDAAFLMQHPSIKVVLEGHCDSRGSEEYNLALGQKRSEAVRRSLTLLGVSDSQIEAVSFGKEKPAVQGTGEDVWAQNRRAGITYR